MAAWGFFRSTTLRASNMDRKRNWSWGSPKVERLRWGWICTWMPWGIRTTGTGDLRVTLSITKREGTQTS
ncbi:hypothetical protein D3C75_999730 [compost metagenome]